MISGFVYLRHPKWFRSKTSYCRFYYFCILYVISVYMHPSTGFMYWDCDHKDIIEQDLYQHEDTNRLYLDRGLQQEVVVVLQEQDINVSEHVSEHVVEDVAEDVSEATSFTKDQVLFIISTMEEHLSGDKPKSIMDLEKKIRCARSSKKQLWEEVASKLEEQFHMHFNPTKVGRKWTTLVDGYKRARDHNNSTGRSPLRFMFFDEMQSLIGDNHDIAPVVTATAAGVVVHRPDELGMGDGEESPAKKATRPKKKNQEKNSLLDYLEERDKKEDEYRREVLQSMQNSQASFERMFAGLIDVLKK